MDIHNLLFNIREHSGKHYEKHVAKLVSDKKREKRTLSLENCPRCGSANVIQKSSCTKECRDCTNMDPGRLIEKEQRGWL